MQAQRFTHIVFPENVDAPFTQKEKAMIDEVYGDKADFYIYSRPAQVKITKDLLRNRIIIVDITQKKVNVNSSMPRLSELEVINPNNTPLNLQDVDVENFNPLRYAFPLNNTEGTTYYSNNGKVWIVIKPYQRSN